MDFKNFSIGSVLTAPTPSTSGTSLVLQSGEGSIFPSVYPFNIVIWPSGSAPDSSNAEIATVTAISTDTLTIVRAKEGTSARSIIAGDQVMFAPTAELFRIIEGHFTRVTADDSRTSNNTAQDVFQSGRNTITLKANTLYKVRGVYFINGGSTSHTLGISFLAGSGLTINDMLLEARGFKGNANTTATATNGTIIDRLANTVVTAGSTTVGNVVKFEGYISVNAGGTLKPQFQFSAAPGGTPAVKKGSFIEFQEVGIDTTAKIGDWS